MAMVANTLWEFVRFEPFRNGTRMALCRCKCGTEKTVQWSKVKSGRWQSCGCIYPTYGMEPWKKSLRNIWQNMIARCHDEDSPQFDYYGYRGIQVCLRWRDSFEAFCDDMGPRPSKKHSIDRIDNNAGYRPDNCRWATRIEQARNKQRSVYLTVNGERKHIREWAENLGCNVTTLENRIQDGWSDEETVLTPIRRWIPRVLLTGTNG